MYCKHNLSLVSVIIPVYNVEEYLERCVYSMVRQSYKNLDIILVDDGSTDNSGKLCDKLAETDSRIRVIHKENGGLSDARNVALDIIEGEWVTFVDSDDWVSEDYIETLLNIATENRAQIGIALYVNRSNSNNNLRQKRECIKVFDNEEGVKALLYQKYFTTSANCKIYEKDIWNGIRFPKGKLYEDVSTIYEVFKNASTVAFINKVIYFYYQRFDSIVRNNFSIQKMDYVENCRVVLEDVKVRYPQLVNGAISRVVWAEIHVLVQMDDYLKYKLQYTSLWNDIRKNRWKILMDSEVNAKNKVVLLLSFGGSDLLSKVYNMINSH